MGDVRRDAAERRAVALVLAAFADAEVVEDDDCPTSSHLKRRQPKRGRRRAVVPPPALIPAARPPGDAHRRLLVAAGRGRARTLTEVERAILVRLLDQGGRACWLLGELATELFGDEGRPGDVAAPLWALRATGLLDVAVVDPEAEDGPLVEVEAVQGRDGVARSLPGGGNVLVTGSSSGGQPEGRNDGGGDGPPSRRASDA